MAKPTPITTLVEGMEITVRLPIEVAGKLMTDRNDVAVLTVLESNRSKLYFKRNGYRTWADNALLLDNVAQFVIHDPNMSLPFDYVTTSEGLFLVVDEDGEEVARAITENMAMRIAASLVAAES